MSTAETAKHTPGPWAWEYHPDFPNDVMALSAGDTDVLICTGTETAAFGQINEANACLVAAAPELLEALETALLELHEVNLANVYGNRPRNPDLTIAAEEQAKAAIRKATEKL